MDGPLLQGLAPDEVATLLRAIRCPHGLSPITLDETGLRCPAGLHPVTDGYVDLMPSAEDLSRTEQQTLNSFGFEWTHFDEPTAADDRAWTRYVRDMPWEELGDALALDAGCGMARYSRQTARRVKGLIALDGSEAVRSAAKTLSQEPNCLVLRGTITDPPVAEESLDLVTCLGVLHHLDDPREGFDSLVRTLRPGGHLLVYLYSKAQGGVRAWGLAAADALRRVTVPMPHPLLRLLSMPIALVLYLGIVLPGRLGERARIRALGGLPMATYRELGIHSLWLDTFDRLSAPIENRYAWTDVAPWYAANNLEVLSVRQDPDLAGLVVLARRAG